MTDLRKRLAAEIEAQGSNMKKISLQSGLGATYVRDFIKRGRGGKLEDLSRVARALGKTPDWLIGAFDAPEQTQFNVRLVPIRGAVQAGIWMEFDDHESQLPPEPVPIVPGTWSQFTQFAYRVIGPSMNERHIFEGDYVICVPYFDARADISGGDIIVVERRRGAMIQRTIKEIVVKNGSFELWPRSNHPKFQEPIIVPNKHDQMEEDGTQIEIVGLVVGRYSPLA